MARLLSSWAARSRCCASAGGSKKVLAAPRVVRSTLVAGQTLLELNRINEGEHSAAPSWLGWDSLLCRSGLHEGGELFAG